VSAVNRTRSSRPMHLNPIAFSLAPRNEEPERSVRGGDKPENIAMAQFDTPHHAARGRNESLIVGGKETAQEAITGFKEVADTFGDAVEESLRRRPYATLAVAAGIGFLFGAAWSR